MEQLLAHLVGDYFFQTDKQAANKYTSKAWCFWHCFLYTVPFLLLTRSVEALTIIFLTHFLIDHYKLAFYVCKWKNIFDDWSAILSGECDKGVEYEIKGVKGVWKTGFSPDRPIWLTTWLFIITDNTLHLLCNYFALRYY